MNGRISDYCTKNKHRIKMFESNDLCEMFTQESCIAALRLIKEARKTSDESWFDKEGAKETVVLVSR